MWGAALTIALALQVTDPVATTRRVLEKAKSEAGRQPRHPVYPREAYLRRGDIGDVRLAPDGRHVSLLRRGETGADLILYNVVTGVRTRIVAGLQGVETAWSGDGRRLWLADRQGLAVVELSGLKVRRILKWDPRRSPRLWSVDGRAPEFAMLPPRRRRRQNAVVARDGVAVAQRPARCEGCARVQRRVRRPSVRDLHS
jgi:hypothetical protein